MSLMTTLRDNIAQWISPRPSALKPIPPGSLPPLIMRGSSAAEALQCGPVWACCRLIAEAISALPGHIFETTAEGKQKATSHRYYRMLTMQPNPYMTMPLWLETVVLHLMLYGNAYIVPEVLDGEVIALWPIPPDRVQVLMLSPGIYSYRVISAGGATLDFAPLDLMHVRLFSLDGIIGLSPIEYARLTFQADALGRAYSLALYGNGGRPSGILEVPGNLKPDQASNLRDAWQTIHAGLDNAGKIAVLEGGTSYKPLAIPPEQMEFIAQQKFSVEQIARIFGVPPHLVGAMDKPTYASVEQQGLEFVQYRLQPIVTNLERTLQSALLEAPYFYKLNLAAFERSDLKSRYAAYAVARQWGWMSVNDIRELEDMNSIGPKGDVYLEPLNMVPATGEGPIDEPGIQSVPAAGMQG